MTTKNSMIEQIARIMLKHMERREAIRLARDLHNHVRGNKLVTNVLSRVVENLVENEEEDAPGYTQYTRFRP